MLAKKLKARISKDKTIILHVPDMPPGRSYFVHVPKHRVGKILSTLQREDIYTDAR